LPAISTRKLLFKSLGDGLRDFLRQAKEEVLYQRGSTIQLKAAKPKYLVTKTPQHLHVNRFFDFFPSQKLLILVRDGRALVESFHLSFQQPYERAMQQWATAANKIAEFEQQCKGKDQQYLIVKYEDLHEQTEVEMKKI
jgi:hypothetical protein